MLEEGYETCILCFRVRTRTASTKFRQYRRIYRSDRASVTECKMCKGESWMTHRSFPCAVSVGSCKAIRHLKTTPPAMLSNLKRRGEKKINVREENKNYILCFGVRTRTASSKNCNARKQPSLGVAFGDLHTDLDAVCHCDKGLCAKCVSRRTFSPNCLVPKSCKAFT